MQDKDYNSLCQQLLRSWDKLPAWYKGRVSKGDLTSGSGAAIARSMTSLEISEARWWRDEHIPAMKREVEERWLNLGEIR